MEVYLGAGKGPFGDGWGFIEGRPAGSASETFDNPCDKWFCHAGQFKNTSVFAAQWSHEGAPGEGNRSVGLLDTVPVLTSAGAPCGPAIEVDGSVRRDRHDEIREAYPVAAV